jgi:hypothetical protein
MEQQRFGESYWEKEKGILYSQRLLREKSKKPVITCNEKTAVVVKGEVAHLENLFAQRRYARNKNRSNNLAVFAPLREIFTPIARNSFTLRPQVFATQCF